jgi:hypothetical protein
MSGRYTRMGVVEERTSTVIAACHEDEHGNTVIDHDEIGKRSVFRHVYFAYQAEVEGWLTEQEAEGFTRKSGPTPAATFYGGPTDSPSNCWSAEVEKTLNADEKTGERETTRTEEP